MLRLGWGFDNTRQDGVKLLMRPAMMSYGNLSGEGELFEDKANSALIFPIIVVYPGRSREGRLVGRCQGLNRAS